MGRDITVELEKSMKQRKETLTQSSVLQEAQKLLEYEGAQDLNILRNIGPKSSLSQSEEEKGKLMEIEKAEMFTGMKVYTRSQIVDLGVKYRLKFLRSSAFTSYIDPSVIPAIKDLQRSISASMTKEQAEKRNMTVEAYVAEHGAVNFAFDQYELKEKFYILAPSECFETNKRSAYLTKEEKDPVMFYKKDDDHYVLVKKWGTDFTPFRRILGWVTQNSVNHFWAWMIPINLLIISAALLFSPWIFIGLLINFAVFTDGEHAKDFFGKRYVTSTDSFYI